MTLAQAQAKQREYQYLIGQSFAQKGSPKNVVKVIELTVNLIDGRANDYHLDCLLEGTNKGYSTEDLDYLLGAYVLIT